MAIKRIQPYQVYGVTSGLIESRDIELICCPELDHHGYGSPNLPKESCEEKQKNKEIYSCYGGCKGKQYKKQKVYHGPRPTGPKPNSKRTKFFALLNDKKGKAFTYPQAAELLGIKENTLRAYYADYCKDNPPSKKLILQGVLPGEKKKEALALIALNPLITKDELMAKFKVSRQCANHWMNEFRGEVRK